MTESPQPAYQVLARKYRPQTFADLIGQDAMVRTLKNAFAADRIAHAFILTGIRGTGKTTTARIVAKGLNCIGADGTGGPTTEPCGVCEHCVAIAEGRHVDVLEMDAASRTGVGDVREIIDSVRYRAASARYKIYIVDEVHMLSTSAFNALLKTLEEPPEHVKFIFATTEIRKVPVTVLSRCQRFDLRRIEPETMIAHLAHVAEAEGAGIAQEALALITRAAEGSVRDAMSLMDQAIAHGHGETTADEVRAMLGLADRGRVLDLFDLVMQGDAGGALTELSSQYADGADPMAVLRDLAEITHWLSVVKITPEAADDPTIGPDIRARGQDMADRLPMRVLTRTWQMLLKALEEVAAAPNAMMAAEMAIIRLTHVADLPSPEELVRKLQEAPPPAPHSPSGAPAPSPGAAAVQARAAQAPRSGGGPAAALAVEPATALARFGKFEQVVELIRANRDVRLLVEVETNLRLVSYAPGRIEFQPTDAAPRDLAQQLGQRLQAWTGVRWAVSVTSTGGGRTIAETRDREADEARARARELPLVQAVLAAFPDAEISAIRSPEAATAEAEDAALPEADDDWDPFED
ncbi:DNA polymerase III subunit gamma/tau [Roseitranquillus sediminis]|uniref:DNA polymerase III subunit gamma/tau n=1 Tax=Roseitranquillus sediminis TaxID=2809051 RepID=UPI001D0C0757|nr:DNA polymerase III subunit gamma/tau [Roseitranquillus sediminis]MBM9593269.1 DNA polymerase III subunit gamma/tau [Roseitranquillus sediminis]